VSVIIKYLYIYVYIYIYIYIYINVYNYMNVSYKYLSSTNIHVARELTRSQARTSRACQMLIYERPAAKLVFACAMESVSQLRSRGI
jgi:hypothetical protein